MLLYIHAVDVPLEAGTSLRFLRSICHACSRRCLSEHYTISISAQCLEPTFGLQLGENLSTSIFVTSGDALVTSSF